MKISSFFSYQNYHFPLFNLPKFENQDIQISDRLRRQTGDKLIILLGLRGSGKTSIIRKLEEQKQRIIRIPIRTTRELRPDEKKYYRDTGIIELISMSHNKFTHLPDIIAAREFNNTYYGVCYSDILDVYSKCVKPNDNTNLVLSSGAMYDAIAIRKLFPNAQVIHIKVSHEIRLQRLTKDSRPTNQKLGESEFDRKRIIAYDFLADRIIDNTGNLESSVFLFRKFLQDVSKKQDENILSQIKLRHLKLLLNALLKTNIPIAVYAGTGVAVLTKNRLPTDIDFIVKTEDLKRISQILNLPILETRPPTPYIEPFAQAEIAGPVYTKRGGGFTFPLTESMIERRLLVKLKSITIPILSPEDLILHKALLQRGELEGKHDAEDILAIAKHYYPLDMDYLKQQITALNHYRSGQVSAETRIIPYLKKLEVIS